MQLIVKLTNSCNLCCSYCSEGNQIQKFALNKTLLFKLIDDVPALMDLKKHKNIDFLWHGGEPLTYPKKDLCDVMDYALEKLALRYNVKFLAQTNLTLLDDEWLAIIKKYNIGIGVSLDGYQDLHDANRRTVDGKPTYQVVYDNIIKLKEHDVIPGLLMVLNTCQSIDVERLLGEIKALDVPCKIHAVIPCGNAEGRKDIKNITANYVLLLKEIYKKLFEEEQQVIIEPLNNLMDAIIGKETIKECSFAGTCGESFLCIYNDGSVGFCGRRADEFDLKYGNLQDSTLLELYKTANAQRIRMRQTFLKENDCKNCNCFDLCHGGCTFEAAVAKGVPEAKYPHCEERKQLIEFLKTEGLVILKKFLIKEKRRYLTSIAKKKELLRELENREKQ